MWRPSQSRMESKMLLTDTTANSAGKAMAQSGRERAMIGSLLLIAASLDEPSTEQEKEQNGQANNKIKNLNTGRKRL